MIWRRSIICLLLLIPIPGVCQISRSSLSFVENKGQWNPEYDFATWFTGGNLLVNSQGFNITLYDAEAIQQKHLASHGIISEADGDPQCIDDDFVQGHRMQLSFLGASLTRKIMKEQKSKTYYNFFLGSDNTRWAGKAQAYGKISYTEIYNGIDLAISSVGKNLKYDFEIEPCADPSQIVIDYQGSDLIGLERNGDLAILTSFGKVIEKKPVAFQIIEGHKIDVPVRYFVNNQKVIFDFPEGYNDAYSLTIDPLLIFSTYSGSTADNWGSSATPGEHGNLYSTGVTNHFVGQDFSGSFPATTGAFQQTYGGIFDIAILKYDSLGQNLLYASYLGGDFNDSPHSLVMDKDENLIVLGTTSSYDFPTTFGVISENFNGGNYINTDVLEFLNGSDLIISKISTDGSALLSSTYFGGSGIDGLNYTTGPLTKNYGDENRGDIITDAEGNIFVSSVSWSDDFPAANSFSTTFKDGVADAVIAKLTSDLTSIVWAGFLGGTGYDASHTIKFNSLGNIVVAGGTTSNDFPVTPGAYQAFYSGSNEANGWISVISKDGQNILSSTFTGSDGFDQVYIIDLNSFDEIYAFGQTTGKMPVTPGKYNNPGSGQFVQKFSPDLSTLEWSTVFGTGNAIPNISPTALLVNDCDYIFLAGWGGVVNSNFNGWNSDTRGLPISFDAFQTTTQGSDFYFMVLGDEASNFQYGTYLGGTQSAVHVDGGTSRFDKRGIVYHAVCSGCFAASSDFPTTPGAYSASNNSLNCNNAAFKFDLSQLKAQFRTNSLDFRSPNSAAFCFPEPVVFENLSVGGELFEWRFGDGTLALKNDTTTITHQYDQPGSYVVQLKSIDQNTCIGVDSITKTINVYERQSTVQPDDIVCFNTTYQLSADGGIGYAWMDTDGNVFSTERTPEVILTVDTTFYLEVLESSGCNYFDTVNLTVTPPLIPDFDLVINNNCFDRPQVELVDKSLYSVGDTLYFDFGDGNISELNEVSHSYSADGFYAVRKIGKGPVCTYEKVINVPIFTLKVPNVMTPGLKDGKNDFLVVQFGDGTYSSNDLGLQVHITILNRWGKAVYESIDYQNDWDADDNVAGVYYYEVYVPNYTKCSGWVDVIR